MITKLLPEQISIFWPIIKYAVEESLPPITGEHLDKMNRMLSAMLSGKLEVWAVYTKEDNKFEAILVTQFLYDEASNTKNLLLYCLYGYTIINLSSWNDSLEFISKYAKANGCHSLVAYSANQDLIKIVKSLGANTAYTFISFELNKIV
jgi:hypothetical protein